MNRLSITLLLIATLVIGFSVAIIMPDEPIDRTLFEGAFFPWLGTLLAALIGFGAAFIVSQFERRSDRSIYRELYPASPRWPWDPDGAIAHGGQLGLAVILGFVFIGLTAKNLFIATATRPGELLAITLLPTLIYLPVSAWRSRVREAG